MYGKAIELFLVNGSADSLTTAELSNWNGKAIKIPRTEIAGWDRDDIKGVGSKTRDELLNSLKSVKKIREADLSVLAEIIGSAKAKIVFKHFHPKE